MVQQDADRGVTRVAARRLHQTWGAFLGRVPWEWSVTLTFDPHRVFPVGRRRADWEASHWCDELGWIYRRPIGWVYTTERGRNGQWHAHALLVGLGSLSIAPAAAIWRVRNGYLNTRRVYAGQRAVLYATKEACRTGDVVVADTLTHYRARLGPELSVELHDDQ
jgi:hypothetical protein